MLQRAASNAYSWWWASHVRTKQSKWLEQSLQDMGEKVAAVLKLIEEDGDSFAKRAEMYYKKRPELINFVEESYRAYRSLAERFDHISKELQNANSTLASAFPDQYQFPIDDDDDDDEYSSSRMQRKFYDKPHNPNIPKAPQKFPTKNIKAIMALTSKKNPPKTLSKSASNARNVPKSGLTKSEALNDIDKLQKRILTLQTEKEFAKSSYESGYAKCWEIEEEITGMQEKISKLQDEFGIAQVIEDDEARTLMAEAALKSCQETLAHLQEKQEKAAAEAKAERARINVAREKLSSLKGEFLGTHEESRTNFDEEEDGLTEPKDLEIIRDKIKEHFDVGATSSLSVSEMAEKIDELVNKVIDLETSVSSQTALIHRLRSETDDLQSEIKSLEDDKANLVDGKNSLSDKLREMENKLKGLQDLNRSFQTQNNSLETHFTEARSNLDTISEKLHDVKPDEEVGKSIEFQESTVHDECNSILSQEPESKAEPGSPSKMDDTQPQGQSSPKDTKSSTLYVAQPQEHSNKKEEQLANLQETQQLEPENLTKHELVTPQEAPFSSRPVEEKRKEEDEPDWQQLFVNGLEGKEKVLLAEYTSTLRNYKEVKKKLGEIEKKSQDDLSEIVAQLKELKSSHALKDDEIHSLRQKLSVLQKRLDEYKNSKEVKDMNSNATNEDPSPLLDDDDDDDIKVMAVDEAREISPVEEKLRADIDEILEENLNFWMRFSTSFGQIQKFQSGVQDLQEELAKLNKNNEKKDGSSHGSNHMNTNLKSDVRPIYKHLRQIQTELTVWLEQSEKLKDELQSRFSQLCNIQEEITRALNLGAEDDDMKFTSFQAAKFQGEVANMQQENHKVADELQAGMDHITSLLLEVETTVTKLNEELGFSGSETQNENQMRSGSQGRVPLRSFIFGVKPQKKKQSIFSCMHPAMMHRRYQHLKNDKSS